MEQLRFTCMAGGMLGMMGMPAIGIEEVDAHRPMEEGAQPTGNASRSQIRFHESMIGVIPSTQPLFIDGDFGQFDLPVEEQDIVMILPEKVLKCKTTPSPDNNDGYMITEFDYDLSSELVTSEVGGENPEGE